ncbi:WD40-repeat-containing domain protein [Fusarium redolens]|uniref:WD40-repeat-containing domain protein n=1 Tax=Fusarium redolens TaxID=48865 RepID=A0A9P9KWJ3_FUSRE|nr:WD40-repeat-containing domain protein [Fusarium redolens]KAH7269673.1 WD40-repeat-containing domain protein [Fusarium redolens]
MANSSLTQEFFQGPITSLAFFRDAEYLLAGEDTHLTLYDLQSSHALRVGSVRVFSAQPIHGIRLLSNGRVLAWGAAQIAVVSNIEGFIENTTDAQVVVKKTAAPDWIYDVAPSPYDDSSAVLATAHNEVVHLHLNGDDSPVIGSIVSPSRPILYAARLKWLDQDTVLMAGGTIFGEILVWRCYVSESRSELLAILNGHEGSIFGVDISEELPCDDGTKLRLIASCSDDRTVRIWNITGRDGSLEKHDFAAPRETGFGSKAGLDDGPRAEELRPIATIMGHLSRIWGVKFAQLTEGETLPESPLSLYSFGEDSTAQRWQLNLDISPEKVSGSLKHIETYAVHDGKHLWAHVVVNKGDQTLIATGGADSKISLITQPASLAPAASGSTHELLGLGFDEIAASLPNLRTLKSVRGNEIFSRYDFISDDRMLVTTNWGRLLLGTFQPALEWKEIELEDELNVEFQTCYTLQTIGDGAAILGTTSGKLYYFSESQGVKVLGSVPGKIFNISILSSSVGGLTELIVHIHGTSDSQYFSIDWRTGAVVATADIRGIDKRFVAISAARFRKDLIAIGSRHGFLALLRQSGNEFRPILDFRFNTRDAITGLVPLPTTDGQEAPLYFLATSRDTKYRIYEIEDLGDEVRLHLQHEVAAPSGADIEGGWFTQDESPELILYGFKSKNFIVWNETRREEIASIDCGGAHRTFTIAHDPSNHNRVRFGYTRATKLYIFSQHNPMHRPLRYGTHGREIRGLSASGRYIATGAEDTTVRIWEYEDEQCGTKNSGGLRCVTSTKLHISGLQKIHWVGDDYLLSSAGFEEFFVWSVRRLDSQYKGLGILCEAILEDKSPAADLRIMDFDACKVDNGSIIITMVLSNSTLKTYRYTPGEGFHLLARMSYTGACLTQVRHLGVDENGLSALTAATDGHLTTWEVTFGGEVSSHVLVQVAPVHQSSIKCLDLQPTPEGFLVLTGGDDNGLGVTTLVPMSNESDKRRYTTSSRGIVRKAHAAAINGVVLVRRGGETFGITVSNDQRVKVWRVQVNNVKLVADSYSGVADPGDIAVIGESDGEKVKVVLGGVGAEVWSW